MFDVFLIPNKSLAGVFWASLLLFIIPFIIRSKKRPPFIVLFLLAIILLVLLVLSNSRSGWLGCASALTYIAYQHIHIRRKKVIISTAVLFLIVFFLGLLFYKSDSSSGRKHIYSVSVGMLRDNWVHGIGLGKFKATFNEYQADYFTSNNIDNKRALLADNTFYVFNDYLQWVIESGLIGLVLLLAAVYFTIRRIIYLHNENLNRPVLVSATAPLICVAVAALFSYPLQVISIQAVVLACLGILAFYNCYKKTIISKNRIITFLYRGFIIVLMMFFVSKVINDMKMKRIEKSAFDLVRSGYKTDAINKYKLLVEEYPANGHNWFLYGQQLYYANRLTEAYENLNKGIVYYVDNKVYKLKADIEQELNMYVVAEKSYLRTIYMVPNRMGSRLDLLNFYVARNDTAKSIYWAKSILKMTIKVPSDKVDNMLRETKDIFEKLEQ